MSARAPTLAEFAAIVVALAPRRRRVGSDSRLGVDLGFDLLALSELDVVLFERYGGAVGFGTARADLLALTVREAYAVCVERDHRSVERR